MPSLLERLLSFLSPHPQIPHVQSPGGSYVWNPKNPHAGSHNLPTHNPPLPLHWHDLPEDLMRLGQATYGSREALTEVLKQAKLTLAPLPGGKVWLAQDASDNSAQRIVSENAQGKDEYGLRRLTHHNVAFGLAIDVGANIGDQTIAMARLRPQMQILAIEPVPSTYFMLRWNLFINNITLLRAAELKPGGRAGVLALNAATTGDPTPNRSVEILFGGRGHSQDARLSTAASLSDPKRTDKYLKWSRRRVPSLFLPSSLGGWRRVQLLKLDCELCEYDIIASSAEWFADKMRVRYVGGELHTGARVSATLRETVTKALVARRCLPPPRMGNGRMNC